MTAEFKRLGKRGAYRLGQLRAQGIGQPPEPRRFRPRFLRPDHRWPAPAWLLGLLTGVLLIAAGAVAGLWFVPFAAGLLAGLANWAGRWRVLVAVPAVGLMAALGWVVPLVWYTLRGQPSAGAARVIAAELGLPAHATAGFAVTVLIAVAQAVTGYWLGRAVTPLPARD